MSKLTEIVDTIPDEERALWSKMDSIGERITQLMEVRGFNQQDLAETTSKHKSYISRVLGGGVNLTLTTISEFERTLGGEILRVPLAENGGDQRIQPPRRQ